MLSRRTSEGTSRPGPARPRGSARGRRGGVLRAAVAALAIGWSGPSPAVEPTVRDLQVLARAMGFLDRSPTGTAEIGIVFPEQSAAGRAEAQRIAASFGTGLRAGNLTVTPRLVTAESAAGVGLGVLLLTDAAVGQAAALARSLAGRSVLTVATDRGLVDAGLVVMAVRGEPRVEILVNRAAAQAAGVGFAPAFRMMIQER